MNLEVDELINEIQLLKKELGKKDNEIHIFNEILISEITNLTSTGIRDLISGEISVFKYTPTEETDYLFKKLVEITHNKFSTQEQKILKLNETLDQKDRQLQFTKNLLIESEELSLSESASKFKKRKITEMANIGNNISKIIHQLVPIFTGEKTENISERVDQFLTSCDIAHECLDIQNNAENLPLFLRILKTRLTGDAFELINGRDIGSMEEFREAIKNSYLRLKTLDEVLNELRNSYQKPSEDIKTYARRLEKINATAKRIVAANYNAAQSVGLNTEIDNVQSRMFKIGLSNPILKQFCLGRNDNFSDLVLEVINTELMLNQAYRPNQFDVATTQQLNPNYYFPQMLNNPKNFNFPTDNLGNFQESGFGIQQMPNLFNPQPNNFPILPTNPNFALSQQNLLNSQSNLNLPISNQNPNLNVSVSQQNAQTTRCNFCNNLGHNFETCPSRLSSAFCTKCGNYGHLFTSCPTNLTASVNAIQTSRTQNRISFCKWCRRRGHSDDNCFTIKRYQQSQNSGNAEGHGRGTSSVTQDQN